MRGSLRQLLGSRVVFVQRFLEFVRVHRADYLLECAAHLAQRLGDVLHALAEVNKSVGKLLEVLAGDPFLQLVAGVAYLRERRGDVLDLPVGVVERLDYILDSCFDAVGVAHSGGKLVSGCADVVQGGGDLVDSPVQDIQTLLALVDRLLHVVAGSVDLVEYCFQCTAELAQLVKTIAESVQGRTHAVQRLVHPGGYLINAVSPAVVEFSGAVGDIVCGVLQIVHLPGKPLYPVVYCVAGALGVVDEVVHKSAEHVHLVKELLNGVLVEVNALVRLHLPDYTADVLPAEDLAVVYAGVDIAALSADDSADIVSYVLITYSSEVLAPLDNSIGVACDTSGVRHGGGLLRRHYAVPVDILNRQLGVTGGGIDARPAGAVEYCAGVGAGDSACAVGAGDGAGCAAVGDKSALLVGADDTADVGGSLDGAREGAPGDVAGVAAGDPADVLAAAGGGNITLDREVLDQGAALNVSEQSHIGAVRSHRYARYRMSCAVKYAAEHRNGGVFPGKLDIRSERNIQVAAVGIQPTVLRELQESLRVRDRELILSGLRAGAAHGEYLRRNCHSQGQRSKNGDDLFHYFHCLNPPFRP